MSAAPDLSRERAAVEIVGRMVARRRSHGAECVVGGFMEITHEQAAALDVVHGLAAEALAAREANASLYLRVREGKIGPRPAWDKAGRP